LYSGFFKGKKVFITGHTGFKGSWLCMWLSEMGAEVTGYSLNPPTEPSLFEMCHVVDRIHSVIGDVRDYENLLKYMKIAEPKLLFTWQHSRLSVILIKYLLKHIL